MKDGEESLRQIENAADPVEKTLLLAALVSAHFRAAGTELVVVGGAAIAFYTRGAHVSGDIDLCRIGPRVLSPEAVRSLMGGLGATGGPRTWNIAGLRVDLLGEVESEALTPFREWQTPLGAVTLIQPEAALVERILFAHSPKDDPDAAACARELMAACVAGAVPVDWSEVRRLAALPEFGISGELERMEQETRGTVQTAH